MLRPDKGPPEHTQYYYRLSLGVLMPVQPYGLLRPEEA